MSRTNDNVPPAVWPAWTRAFSLFLAGATCLSLLIFPHMIGRALTPLDHTLLPLFLLSAAAAIAFGLGFRFQSATLRRITAPPLVWPVLAASLAAMIIH